MQDIKDYLSYDPLTGLFTRLKNVSNCKAGSIAGTKNCEGYTQIGYKGKQYKAHRLAWYFTYGYMPDVQIDHKNRVRDDNRLCNLRVDTNGDNNQNASQPRSNNKSGYLGVTWHKPLNKWTAYIYVNGKNKNLGYYDTPEEAHEAYLCAKRKYHPFWVENKVA